MPWDHEIKIIYKNQKCNLILLFKSLLYTIPIGGANFDLKNKILGEVTQSKTLKGEKKKKKFYTQKVKERYYIGKEKK